MESALKWFEENPQVQLEQDGSLLRPSYIRYLWLVRRIIPPNYFDQVSELLQFTQISMDDTSHSACESWTNVNAAMPSAPHHRISVSSNLEPSKTRISSESPWMGPKTGRPPLHHKNNSQKNPKNMTFHFSSFFWFPKKFGFAFFPSCSLRWKKCDEASEADAAAHEAKHKDLEAKQPFLSPFKHHKAIWDNRRYH